MLVPENFVKQSQNQAWIDQLFIYFSYIIETYFALKHCCFRFSFTYPDLIPTASLYYFVFLYSYYMS